MAQRPGGVKPGSQPVNDEVRNIANQVKGALETKLGKTFSQYDPESFTTQVVAGINYFIKINVGNGEYVHARVYKDLQGHVSLNNAQGGKSSADDLEHF